MAEKSLVLMGCGDVGPIHEPMEAYSALARPTLATADIRFAQCERVYSELGALQVHSGGHHSRVKPHLASVFSDCKFDVLSVASNHAMDWGEDALLDSIALLQKKGIQTVGAGHILQEANGGGVVRCHGSWLRAQEARQGGHIFCPHSASPRDRPYALRDWRR